MGRAWRILGEGPGPESVGAVDQLSPLDEDELFARLVHVESRPLGPGVELHEEEPRPTRLAPQPAKADCGGDMRHVESIDVGDLHDRMLTSEAGHGQWRK